MRALLIVDILRDFCPGGSLAVADGAAIIPNVNMLSTSGKFDVVIKIKDKHPKGHISFASRHGLSPFSVVDKDVVWPDHCVDGTEGADIHPDVDLSYIDYYIVKGMNKEVDSYSAFLENDRQTKTGLCDILEPYKEKMAEGEKFEIYVVGIATDVCVKATVLDSLVLNWEGTTTLIEDACAGVTVDGVAAAIQEMEAEGAIIMTTEDFLES